MMTRGRGHCIGFAMLLTLLLTITATGLEAGEAQLVPTAEGVFRDTVSGKEWQASRSGRIRTSGDALAYLAQLNGQGGQGWRLPSREELYQLMNRFDLKNNGEVKVPIEGKYWLKDGDGNVYAGAWEIGDGCGPNRKFFAGNTGHVRAVRP